MSEPAAVAPVPARPRRRGLGEEGAGALAALAEYRESQASRAALPPRRRVVLATGRVAAGVLLAVYLFTVALKLLSAAAPGVAVLFERLAIDSVPNLVGFGWLAAYGALSGSPVAALALSLLDGGAIDPSGALAMLSGSRMGASLIVLVVGFIAYLRGRGRPDGVYVGVVALLTTVIVYIPATALGLWLLDTSVLDGPARLVPTGWADLPSALASPLVDPVRNRLPSGVLFGMGVVTLLSAFWVFDRVLPNLDPPSPRFERLSRRFRSARAMFLFGGLVTSITMSVALSVTILVPLTMKGVVRRKDVIGYVMGANITTFLDTLFASLLLDARAATPVVLAEMLAVTAVSVLVFLLVWRPFSAVVLGVASRVSARRRWLAGFLVTLFAVPALLAVI
jgi:Na+/phosphate symporter